MIIREVIPDEREQYNDLVSHILQTYEWGIFREATGVKVSRIGSYEGNMIKSGFQLTLHQIPNTNYTVGYFPRGPALTDELLKNLDKIGKEHNCIFIKIEPDITSNKQEATSNKQEVTSLRQGFGGQASDKLKVSSPILPQHTFHLDLTASEEEIISRMKEKTRYNIKLAQKHEVRVEEKNDPDGLEIFIKIAMETAERQGFFSHPAQYYRELWDILNPRGMAHLLIAYYQQTPLASIMLFNFKDMLYYPYGGSATVYREKMPNHLLHLEAIKLGKRLGCRTYDMWGAYKDNPTEKDPWFGIYRFKEGFGGKPVDYPQTVDLVFQPQLYKLYNFLDPLRFKLLAVKRMILK